MSQAKIKTTPWCPFCHQDVAKPLSPDERHPNEFDGGRCQCGAFYVSDPTGFNIGAAMVDCLVTACGGNWDLAWDLLPDEDYLTDMVEDYDEQTHQIVATRNLDGRKIKGILYFVRLHKEIAGITGKKQQEGGGAGARFGSRPSPVSLEPQRDPKRKKQRADKIQVQQLVYAQDMDTLVDLCFDDKRTLRYLQRLLFEPDEAKRWLVAHVIGSVCGRLSTRKPGMVSDLLHRLFAACVDSASANWGAIEAIGEIIAVRPDIYGAFAGHLLQFSQDSSMQPQTVWALGTIASSRPELIRAMPFYALFNLLESPEPVVRGLALRLFGRIRAKEVAGPIRGMLADGTNVVMYEKGLPLQTSIGRLAAEALQFIERAD